MATTVPLKYLVIFEQGPTSVGASVPDLPGCVAVGRTREDAERLIQGAIAMHLEGMKADGLDVPEPSTQAALVDAKASA